ISVAATSRSGTKVAFVAFVNDISQRRVGERLRNVQFAVTRPLAGAGSWAEAAPQVLQGICETLSWSVGEFWVVDNDANVLRREYDWHRPGKDLAFYEEAGRALTFARGVGLAGRVWATGRPSSIRDLASDRDAPRAAAERLFGYAPDEVIGKEFARLIAEPYRAELKPQLRGCLRANGREVSLGSHETSGLRKDDSTFPLEFNLGRLGPQRLVVGSLRD